MAVMLRPATAQDAQGIARVHVETWRTTYRGLMPDVVLEKLSFEKQAERWDAWLGSQPGSTVLAEQQGQIVGFTWFGPQSGNDFPYQGELYAIYILEAHQRKGIGRSLLRAAAQGLLARDIQDMMLWVLASNPARAFYEKLGGKRMGERILEFDGAPLHEAAYGWPDLGGLIN